MFSANLLQPQIFYKPLDAINQTVVKSALVFDSKYLQYWFCRVRSWIQTVSRGISPFFSKEVITWQLVQLNGLTMQRDLVLSLPMMVAKICSRTFQQST
jgi:hypothetical protein